MLNKIFINYRREDSNWLTLMIYNELKDYYELVFKDINISGGENFEIRIEKELYGCKVFIAVINKNWLAILKDKSGRVVDYALMEIEKALMQKKYIIPILIDDTIMPSSDDLPENIRDLSFRKCRSPLF